MFNTKLIIILDNLQPPPPACPIISSLFYGERQYKVAPELVTYMYFSNSLLDMPTPSPTVTPVPTTPLPSPQPTATFTPTDSTWAEVRFGFGFKRGFGNCDDRPPLNLRKLPW